ncbi:MAG TPA: transketolase [Vicinamibacterales bacterium]|nr:transketolase [Vicinamibacterales bacterium]
MPVETASVVPALKNIATRLRIDSLRATSEAGSGHPTTCFSAADLVAAVFFAEMRYDPQNPQHPLADRFVLSKGHAAPLLYAAWAEAGFIPRSELLELREFTSDLEGHPTPRLPFVDVATGSLGQGLAAGVGMALNAGRIGSDYRTYVLMGDGEVAEGSVWESAAVAEFHKLDSLCAMVDVNGLGQSRATQYGHDMEAHRRRWHGFGWHAIVIDGHDIPQILDALAEARRTRLQPTVILAKTFKGHGVSFLEDAANWHGKAVKTGDELQKAITELEAQFVPESDRARIEIKKPAGTPREERIADVPPPSYKLGDKVATREAYGAAIARLGESDSRVVALDADVKNSTFSDKFEAAHPERFYQCFIAEQAMIGAAMGLAARGAIPFPCTFAAFLSRAGDFIRMLAISGLNVKMAGSHAGVSIGEDGPSQMALEDLSMMTSQPNIAVLYPSDAVAADRLVANAARHVGPVYLRTTRPKLPVLYANTEPFPIGGLKVLRQSASDTATVIGAGVTLYEALAAYEKLKQDGIDIRVVDLYSLQPIDAEALITAGRETGRLITVEDHYAAGGIGDAVARAVAPAGLAVTRLAVREIPRSGTPEELLDAYGISARHIVAAVRG